MEMNRKPVQIQYEGEAVKMAITEHEFCPGDVVEKKEKDKKKKELKKLGKKLEKALKGKGKNKKKLEKMERKLEKAAMKLSLYESVSEERELRHQVELQNAKLEAALQLIVNGNGKTALPEVVVQYDG